MKMILATAILLASALAQASTDEMKVLFTCASAPNVDTALEVYGFGDETGLVDQIAIYRDEKQVADDQGSFDANNGLFKGDVFELDLSRPEAASIRAKLPNPVLAVDQSESLICE